MAMPSSRFPPESGLAQVWSQLDADRRQQAISVVAQMAFNLVKTQAASVSTGENMMITATPLDQAPQ